MPVKTVDVCTMESIGMEITGEDAPPVVASINEYLSVFAAPQKGENGNFLRGSLTCLRCEESLDGALGTFQWGLAHGEGACSKCGWPARAYHSPQHEGESLFSSPIQFILQYHPDHVREDKSDD